MTFDLNSNGNGFQIHWKSFSNPLEIDLNSIGFLGRLGLDVGVKWVVLEWDRAWGVVRSGLCLWNGVFLLRIGGMGV